MKKFIFPAAIATLAGVVSAIVCLVRRNRLYY